MHFAGSIVVPESVVDPLGYYLNNTCKSRSLIACAVAAKIPYFIFSSGGGLRHAQGQSGHRGGDARADLALR
jgi:UDP-glucose 4-epimerase